MTDKKRRGKAKVQGIQIVSFAVLFLGCLFMFWEKNGRMLHDLLAGTMVTVRNK
mgnify:CR=1 FL=1